MVQGRRDTEIKRVSVLNTIEIIMGRSKGNRNGGRPSYSATNGYGGGGDKFTFTDIDDEPKFIELPDDFETESDIEERERREEEERIEIERLKKQKEERKRKEKEAKKREEEAKKKELEAKRKAEQDAKRKQEEESKAKELEAKKKRQEEEEAKKLEANRREDVKRKELEGKKKAEEEAKRRLEDAKQKELAAKKKAEQEAKKRLEEENKVKELEAKKKKEEDTKRKELEAKRKAEEEARKEEEEAKKRKEEENRKRKELEEDAKRRKKDEATSASDTKEQVVRRGQENIAKAEEEIKKREANKSKAKEEVDAKIVNGGNKDDLKNDQDVKKEDGDKKKPEHRPKGDCVVCGQLARTFCSSCKHVFYCTREHQKGHWRAHKEDCRILAKLPYRVERNDKLGRHLVATRDIPAGTLILNELPMIVGPRQLSKPVCLGCHKELKEDMKIHICSRCHWPLCSRKCEDSKFHDPECRLIRYGGSKVKIEQFGQINMMYACITVLRALSLMDGPQLVWKDYTKFCSHLNERMKTEVYTKVNKEKVVFFIHYYLKLINKFSDLEILETCGRLDTNCFELRQDGMNLRAMYRTACLLSHDCSPNTKHTFGTSGDLDISLYATRDIESGGVISATYTHALWDTPRRREHLWRSKCFWCACARCRDPTEFGSYLTCGVCEACGGRTVMTRPLDIDADWSCEKCSKAVPAAAARRVASDLTDELKSGGRWDRSDPSSLERFLTEKADVLPEESSLAREVQAAIVEQVSVEEDVDSEALLRKSILCKKLLDLADKIDPGLSKWRGQLLFELQSASVVLAQRAAEEGKISDSKAKEIFLENAERLREAVGILSVEPDAEFKAKLQRRAKRLQEMIEEVDCDCTNC